MREILFSIAGLIMLQASYLKAYWRVRASANSVAEDLSAAAAIAIRNVRRVLVAMAGFTLIFVGLAMMVLPGPATVVIPLGLAILATEFMWAKRLLQYFYQQMKHAAERISGNGPAQEP